MTESRRALAIVLVGAAVTTLFLGRFDPARRLLLDSALAAAAAALVLLASYAAGILGCRVARAGEPHADEAVLIGFPTFGTLIAVIAWIGIALEPVVLVVTIVAAAAGVVLLVRSRPSLPRFPALLWIPIAFAIVEALLPVSSPDELIYKLGVPHTYRMFGRMLELPLHSHSYFTLAPHFADLSALIAGGGIAAKLARLGVYLAALAAILRLARRVAGEGAAWIAAVFAWTPALMIIAGWCWDEWIVIGLLVVSIDRWLDSRSPLSFVALGAAIACKYTALPWLVAFAIVVLWRERRLALRAALLVVAFGGFFYVRNMIWTGSPIAPLLAADAPPVIDYRGSAVLSLLTGKDVFDPALVDESLGIVLPVSVILALLVLRDASLRDLLLVGALQLPLMLFAAATSRNLLSALAPLAIAGGKAAIDVWRGSARAVRSALAVVAAIALAAQLVLVAFVLETYDPMTWLSGRESSEEYIARRHVYAKPFNFLESTTPDSARILLLGETRVFDLDRQAIAGGNLDGPRIASWLARFQSPAALHADMRRMGITHVLMRKAFVRSDTPAATIVERESLLLLPPPTHANLTSMLRAHALLRYRDDDYLVFELR